MDIRRRRGFLCLFLVRAVLMPPCSTQPSSFSIAPLSGPVRGAIHFPRSTEGTLHNICSSRKVTS